MSELLSTPAAPPPVRTRWLLSAAALLLLVAGCASPDHRAPVEDRSGQVRPVPAPPLPGGPTSSGSASGGTSGSTGSAAAAPAEAPRLPPGAENAGKPGYYTVRPGDTLFRIGLDNGQGYRDIARWNGLDNPNVIEVGQVLRVAPPAASAEPANGAVTKPVAPAGRVDSKPLSAASAPGAAPAVAAATTGTAGTAPAAGVVAGAAPGAATAPATSATPAATPAAPAALEPDADLGWAWPANGSVLSPFEENKTKGLAISGKAGDPVLAAADGRVVYAGSGLRGYGNLVIVKHNNLFLSAYAHNQTLLVKEDQIVRRGQKIAEMGSTEADRVQLHFEIRRQGKPVDPARLLPAR
jgi:lipoprotein NlpD